MQREAKRKELSDLFAKVNQDAEYRRKMKEGGFVIIDVPYEKVADFMAQKGKEYAEAAREVGMIK